MKKKILVTSALPYVNNIPHLGNLIGAVLSADVFARFMRSSGFETLYVCGSDEHGTTTETKALEENVSPSDLCDKYYKIHKEIYDWFNISFDIFGRTSSKEQVELTQKIFLKLYENGFVVEDVLKQTYCEHDKMFLADRFVEGTCPYCGFEDARGDQCDGCSKILNPTDLKNSRCKICGEKPVVKSVNHLFLDLEKLQPVLSKWVKKQSKIGLWSENAIRVTNAWFKEGLTKRCITRDLSWGVPVPLKGWENKVFYVWFDAPIGYISITKQLLGEEYVSWWNKPDEVELYQFMGKDNIPFHSIVFPGSLIGAGNLWTKAHTLSCTEYLQYEHGKFSKSRNTGVFGDDAINTGLPSDVFRYYLLSIRPETSDSTFTWSEFGEKINNELVATFGNLVNRTFVFINRFFDAKISKFSSFNDYQIAFLDAVKEKEKEVSSLLRKSHIKQALFTVIEIARLGNAFYQKSEPWKVIKTDRKKAEKSLFILANLCKDLAILIEPFMPDTSKEIFSQLNFETKLWSDLGVLSVSNIVINKPKHLFEKIEKEKIDALKEKFGGNSSSSNNGSGNNSNNDASNNANYNGSNNSNSNNNVDDSKNVNSLPKDSDKYGVKKIGASKIDEQKVFSGFDLRVAKITNVSKHPSADKLYIEELDVGFLGKRQIISGLVPYYKTEELIGKNIVLVANLASAKLRGELSEGMLLAAENKEGVVGIISAKNGKPGDKITLNVGDESSESSKENFSKDKISIDEFFSINLVAKGKDGVFLNDVELVVRNDSGFDKLFVDRDVVGKVN